MSTSSSTAPPSALGECVVCGKNATTRCSSCAQGGVDWMYFCSRDHQKLIWSVHKRVCGKRFKWPALEQDELEAMIELSKAPMRYPGKSDNKTWLDGFMLQIASERTTMGPSLSPEALFEIAIKAVARGTVYSQSYRERLRYFRHMAYQSKFHNAVLPLDGRQVTFSDVHEVVAADPFGCLAHYESRFLPSLETQFGTSWYSDLQHRLLLIIAVYNATNRVPPPLEPVPRMLQMDHVMHTVCRAFALVRVDILPNYPEEAKQIAEVYLPRLCDDLGFRMNGCAISEINWKNLRKGNEPFEAGLED